MSGEAPSRATRPLSVAVYGYFGTQQGMRYVADATVDSLRAAGVSVAPVTVDLATGSLVDTPPVEADINLFHVNPDAVVRLVAEAGQALQLRGRANAIVPYWEVTALPAAWLAPLRAMDLVLAPTRFVADVVDSAHLGVDVLHYPQVVDVPHVGPDRARFGLPAAATVFGYTFGAAAAVERKNPWAVIDAFGLAFPDERDVRLVVRASPVSGPIDQRLSGALAERAREDVRIIIHDEPLGYRDVLQLYASLDAYVSLHRTEGLGLGMMESMALGTPAIATGWSGNTDFMSEADSLLVASALVAVDVPAESPYAAARLAGPASWAEPDVADAARQMRRLYAMTAEERTELGRCARNAITERQRGLDGQALTADLEALRTDVAGDERAHTLRVRALSALGRRERWLRVARRIRSALRG